MDKTPVIDGRDQGELLGLTKELASYYIEEWNPESGDVGTVLLELFSGFAEDVVERLDRVPSKHRASFFDALGFSRIPSQPSKLPLTFRVVDGVEENVVIPEGTRAIADATDDRPEQTFEIASGDGFEAVPSNVVWAYSVDPSADRIIEHWNKLTDGSETELFGGTNLQEHVLYIGHSDLLTLQAGATIRLEIETTGSIRLLKDVLTWEYYGVEHLDGEEVEGWHPAKQNRYTRREEAVELRLQLGGMTVEKAFPETLAEETAEGDLPDVTSRWIRCRGHANEFNRTDLFSIEVRSVFLRASATDLVPDSLLYNDVPLSTGNGDEEVYPFGESPRPLDAFYVACSEAFSTTGTTVELVFDAPSAGDDVDTAAPRSAPRLSWEYWNGVTWERIADLRDGSNGMTEGGTVAFAVPDELEPTTVSGRNDYWIRARITGGAYSRVQHRQTAEGSWEIVTEGELPRFDGIAIRYDQRESATNLLTYNNLTYSDDLVDERPESFEPFVGPGDETQTLYVGFDGALSDGPVNLLFSMTDKAYPAGFNPGVQWEYCREPEREQWSALPVRDGTEGLTESGIVTFVFPEETVPLDRFGQKRHWIRARVTAREFVSPAPPSAHERKKAVRRSSPEAHERTRTLPTERPTGTPTETPPVLGGMYLNTGWAYNVQTIDDEIVGSSDGAREQTFSVSTPPITDEGVWVDETAALSEERRAALRETQPGDIEEVKNSEGEPVEFWVQWQPTADFLASDGDSRHYVFDRLRGTLAFGDGTNGRIPPRGRNNIRIDYRTGGGIEGNVETGAVTALNSSIPFIDSVTNPEPGTGGADGEPMERLLERAPRQLRDRGKAVSAADFERVAMSASGELVRARCVPGMDEAGDHSPGWVTLLIVPRARARKPVPSVGLTRRVQEVLRERAPAALVDAESSRLVVRGPSYVEASTNARLSASGVESVSALERTATEAVAEFLHPLSGGPRGTGWEFGELPPLSGLYSLLEGIEGVGHVETLSVRFRGYEADVTVTEGETNPSVTSDTLVCSGTHDIEATGGI